MCHAACCRPQGPHVACDVVAGRTSYAATCGAGLHFRRSPRAVRPRPVSDAAPTAGMPAMPGAPGSPSFDGWARDGLSLAALRAFARAHAGERFALPSGGGAGSASVAFEQLTSGQVLELVVKAATAADACSYAALLIAQARAARRGPRAPRSRRGCAGARVAVRVLTRRTRVLAPTPSARATAERARRRRPAAGRLRLRVRDARLVLQLPAAAGRAGHGGGRRGGVLLDRCVP